tara:strand:- start:124 stop:327 length:204 start_codon:yes stop_codon:yes gene_type:complete
LENKKGLKADKSFQPFGSLWSVNENSLVDHARNPAEETKAVPATTTQFKLCLDMVHVKSYRHVKDVS